MRESRRNGQPSRLLPATAFAAGLVSFSPGSLESRAAARALVIARQGNDAEDDWDRLLDCTGLAERLQAAIERTRERVQRGELLPEERLPIYIPQGKEDTVRRRLAARINAAAARMAGVAQDGITAAAKL